MLSDKDYASRRRHLGLRTLDASAGTGIPLYRIVGAEHGRLRLSRHEEQRLRRFLEEAERARLDEDGVAPPRY